MKTIIALLAIITITLFFIGLKNPNKSLFWIKGERTKKKSKIIYGISSILILFLIGVLNPKTKKTKTEIDNVDFSQIIQKQEENLAYLSQEEAKVRDSLIAVLEVNPIYHGIKNNGQCDVKSLYILHNISEAKLNRTSNSYSLSESFTEKCNESESLNQFVKSNLKLLYYGGLDSVVMRAINQHISKFGYYGKPSSKYDTEGALMYQTTFNHALVAGIIEHDPKNKMLLSKYCEAIENNILSLSLNNNFINQQLVNENSFNKFLKFNYSDCSCYKDYEKMFSDFKENCINDLYGSCTALEQYTKEHLKDPDSFEHISTSGVQKKEFTILTMKYRAKNSFNGYVVGSITAKMNGQCEILEILSSN